MKKNLKKGIATTLSAVVLFSTADSDVIKLSTVYAAENTSAETNSAETSVEQPT